MKIINITITFISVFSLVILSSCTHSSGKRSHHHHSAAQTEIELDHNQCVSNGFTPGTFEYRECRDKLMKQRAETSKYNSYS